jgi:hypothetical protein
MKAVEAQLRAQGIRLNSVEHREIVRASYTYLNAHRDELIEQAAARVATTPSLRKLVEREERYRARRAKLSTDAQAGKSCSANGIPVQNSRSEWSR